MVTNKIPEIFRLDLGKVVLRLKALGVTNVEKFNFIEPPLPSVIAQTIQHLKILGALSHDRETLTEEGSAMLKLETDPDYSTAILEAIKLGCSNEVISIISMLGVSQRLFLRGYEESEKNKSDTLKFKFCHESGDLLTFLRIFEEFIKIDKKQRKEWCDRNRLSYYALKEANRTKLEFLQL